MERNPPKLRKILIKKKWKKAVKFDLIVRETVRIKKIKVNFYIFGHEVKNFQSPT